MLLSTRNSKRHHYLNWNIFRSFFIFEHMMRQNSSGTINRWNILVKIIEFSTKYSTFIQKLEKYWNTRSESFKIPFFIYKNHFHFYKWLNILCGIFLAIYSSKLDEVVFIRNQRSKYIAKYSVFIFVFWAIF